MAFTVETYCTGSFQSPHCEEKTLEFLTNYKNSIGNYFAGLESFTEEEADTYRWTFKSLSYGAYHLQITFLTRFEKSGTHEIQIIPIKEGERAFLSGRWQLTPLKEGTQVSFEATLVGELPLPGLMKPIVTPLAQKEVKKLFDRYITNVAKAI